MELAQITYFSRVAVAKKTHTRNGGKIDYTSYEPLKEAIEKKTTKLAAVIQRKNGKVHTSLKTKMFFQVMRMLQRMGWNEADVNYWRERGWTEKKRPWKK